MKKLLLRIIVLMLSISMIVVFSLAAGPVTIQFWHNYDAGAGQIDVLNQLIAQFEEVNPGITVNQVYLEWQALKNNVVAGATTGILPDVFRGDIGFVPQFIALNILLEMDTVFPDYVDVADAVLEAPNSTAKAGDHYYGIASNTNTKILYYNKDLVTTVPTTLDEMWATAEEVSSEDVIGFCEAWMGGWNLCQYIWSYGSDILAPDYSTATGYINGSVAVAVIQKFADLYAVGAFSGPTIDPGALPDTDGMGIGKYAMTIDGPWKAKDLSTKYPDLQYGAVQMPTGPAGSIGVLGGEDFMIFKTSDAAHQDAAWKFIKFMIGKDAQIEMAKVGQMPVNKEALADKEVLEVMPLLSIFADALQTCKARPVTPKWGGMEGIINTKATEAVLGQKPVQTAMDEAAVEINALLQQ
ncbi:extracellular solute-binding protein [Candidatus Atribacteria bacterium 1244-E10-H5-B2]|nr:MAG: extracellular solute-binding protein [Candidatus Atribacteria bacterium 1244-E10-H5-B2]